MKIIFFVDGTPIAKGRPQFVRETGIAYTPAKTREAESYFLYKSLTHAPKKPIEGTVRLELSFNMPIPKSRSKAINEKLKSSKWVPHVIRPDLDNLVKLVVDALNGKFWLDDKQVSVLIATKQYSEKVGTYVVIESMEEE